MMFVSVRNRARAVAALAVAAALAVGGVALAQGGSGGPAGHAGPAQGKRMPPPPGGPLGGPAGKDLTYAQLHVQRNGEARVIRLDRGKLTAVGASSITLEENDGNQVTVAVDDGTRVLAGPGSSKSVSDLETGQEVIVCGPEGGTAKTIMVPPTRGQLPQGADAGRQRGQLPPPPPGARPGGSEGGPPQMQG